MNKIIDGSKKFRFIIIIIELISNNSITLIKIIRLREADFNIKDLLVDTTYHI